MCGKRWLECQKSDAKNVHIEITLPDAETGRVVPNAKVKLTVLDADGNVDVDFTGVRVETRKE